MPIVASSGAMRAAPCKRPQADALDRHAQQRAARANTISIVTGKRRVQKRDAGPADIGADRIDRAMGEIDQIGETPKISASPTASSA